MMMLDNDPEAHAVKTLHEAYTKMSEQRDALIAFYDVRLLFACYSEILAGLGAAMIHTKVFTSQEVAQLVANLMADCLTRPSRAQVQIVHGTDAAHGLPQ